MLSGTEVDLGLLEKEITQRDLREAWQKTRADNFLAVAWRGAGAVACSTILISSGVGS